MPPPTNKSTASQRRGPTSLANLSTPPASARTNKSSKTSLIIRLVLPTSCLTKYPHDLPTPPEARSKAASPSAPSESANTPPADVPSPPVNDPTPKPESADSSSTAKADSKADTTATKSGVKRELGEVVEGESKSKGRPGPKKKARLDGPNGAGDIAPKRTGTGAAHKLGPKANQGAINAGLRALDRTGTPCRKWQKGGLNLKSFTGHSWAISSWSAPPKAAKLNGDGTQSNTDSKSMSRDLGSSSNVDSDNTPQGANGVNGVSSPAAPIAIRA